MRSRNPLRHPAETLGDRSAEEAQPLSFGIPVVRVIALGCSVAQEGTEKLRLPCRPPPVSCASVWMYNQTEGPTAIPVCTPTSRQRRVDHSAVDHPALDPGCAQSVRKRSAMPPNPASPRPNTQSRANPLACHHASKTRRPNFSAPRLRRGRRSRRLGGQCARSRRSGHGASQGDRGRW